MVQGGQGFLVGVAECLLGDSHMGDSFSVYSQRQQRIEIRCPAANHLSGWRVCVVLLKVCCINPAALNQSKVWLRKTSSRFVAL